LATAGAALRADDTALVAADECSLPLQLGLDQLLRRMAQKSPRVVMCDQDTEEYGPVTVTSGIVTRADLNHHAIRALVYQVLARLEIAVAGLVRQAASDHLTWIMRLSEDSQARILGYWELSKLKGVDTGPVAGATLSELLNTVAKDESLRLSLDYRSRTAFDDAVGGIPGVRNQVMHPVRPLVTDADSCLRLTEILEHTIRLTRRVETISRPKTEPLPSWLQG
jgi:hypothetical protein